MKRAMLFVLLLASIARADYLGSWKINDYVTFTATTHQFSTGSAYAATGNVLLDIYEDANNVEIVNDSVMGQFDSRTGVYQAQVQLLAATGFEKGKHYTAVITATVDGVAANKVHTFQIEAEVDSNTNSGTVTPGTGSITNTVFAQNSLTANAWDSSITWELLLTDLTPAVGKKTWGWWLQKGGGGNALEITGTAAGGSPNTIILQAGSSPDNNKYIPCTVTLVSGKGSPTNRVGLTYTGSTRTLTIGGTWPGDSPDGTTVYKIDIPTTSSLSAQGIAQGGTANTIVLAAGAVTTDDMTGFIQLVSGTGSGAAIYSVRDSYDANDTLVIEGTWAGDSPDTTTYYSFAPSGNIVRDTYNYSYLTQLYETTNNAYTYITDVNNTLNEFYTYQTDVNETHITNLETAISNTYTYLTDVNETYISNLITEVSNTYTYVADMNGVTNLLLHDAYGLEAIRAQISLISGEYDTNDLYAICEKILNAIRY